MSGTPSLNWKEIAILSELFRTELEGAHVDRVYVPERKRFEAGYLKGEWLLRLRAQRKDYALVLSARARHPYLVLYEEKKIPRLAQAATRSVFDLSLTKHLKGARIESIRSLPRERVVLVSFAGAEMLTLVIALIPAVPEALLVSRKDCPPGGPWLILSRSRAKENDARLLGTYSLPDGAQAPDDLKIRSEWLESAERWSQVIDEGLDQEAFDLRKAALERELREKLKHANEQIRSNSASVAEAQSEPAWGRFGDLMKASLPNAAEIVEGTRDVQDYETGTTVKIPADPKLSAREQVEKFFRLERRKQKRLEEAQGRLGLFTESKDRLSAQLERTRAAKQWEELGPSHAHAAQPRSKASRSGSGWQGRDFHSKDGLSIWVGRNKIENLELTFKHAKGNDLWLHVRGRPGAHVVIPLSPGKSAPLETLLDAAALAVYYSGGEDWGKTEVDYTYKKHVKRIKDSSEASYTHNKTLILEPDKERLKRLLNGETA